jgi:hypothetical protein
MIMQLIKTKIKGGQYFIKEYLGDSKIIWYLEKREKKKEFKY